MMRMTMMMIITVTYRNSVRGQENSGELGKGMFPVLETRKMSSVSEACIFAHYSTQRLQKHTKQELFPLATAKKFNMFLFNNLYWSNRKKLNYINALLLKLVMQFL